MLYPEHWLKTHVLISDHRANSFPHNVESHAAIQRTTPWHSFHLFPLLKSHVLTIAFIRGSEKYRSFVSVGERDTKGTEQKSHPQCKKKKPQTITGFFLHCLCEPDPVEGSTEHQSGSAHPSAELLGPADSFLLCLWSPRGPWAGKAEYLLMCKFSLLELNPYSQCAVQICAACGASNWELRLWVSGSEALSLGPRKEQGTLKDAKPAAVWFLPFACVCVWATQAPLPLVPSPMGLRGRASKRSSWGKPAPSSLLLHSSAITALVLGPPGTAASFILAFPAWLGELIRQRNHYGFKSQAPHRK